MGASGKILVIDLGTTYIKVALFDRRGKLVDVTRFESPVQEAPQGTSELSPTTLLSLLFSNITSRFRGLTDVEAITFATQTNSFVLLGPDDQTLTPLILWPDRRAVDLEAEVRQRCGFPEFRARTGMPSVSYQMMLAKLLWVQRNSPEVWAQTARLCLISDWLTLFFTGRHVTEAGAAGLTGLLDIHECSWWPAMLSRMGVPETWLAQVARPGADLGPILPAVASRFGLPPTCRFIVGCLDQYAGAIGAGNVEPGMVSETTGTVLATVRCADEFDKNLASAVYQGPAFRKGLYWRMAFGDLSANLLQWYRDQSPGPPSFEELSAEAGTVLDAGVLRLRTGAPLTTPAEVFDGLTPQHTRGQIVRCIMETVAKALREQVAAISADVAPDGVRSAGGAARSELWMQIKANELGVPTVATECPEPTCLGAAVIAEASLAQTSVPEVARHWVRLKPCCRPFW